MGSVAIFKSQAHRSDESLVFWRLSSKILPDKTNLVYSSFPTFSLSFTRSDDLKHFCFSHWLNFFNWNWPLTSLLLSFLFHHIRQYFRISLLLPVHQISRYSTFLNILDSALSILFLVFFDCLFDLYFLLKSLFIE